MGRLTLPAFWGFSWYQALISNRSLGMGDQLSFPATQRSHSLEGLVASPAKRQLMPTIAIGNSACADAGAGWGAPFPLEWECTTILGIELIRHTKTSADSTWYSRKPCIYSQLLPTSSYDRVSFQRKTCSFWRDRRWYRMFGSLHTARRHSSKLRQLPYFTQGTPFIRTLLLVSNILYYHGDYLFNFRSLISVAWCKESYMLEPTSSCSPSLKRWG